MVIFEMKRFNHVNFLPVLILILAACQGKVGLPQIVNSSTCGPPCWMDIIPGVTSKDEALSDLQSMTELVDVESIYTRTYASAPQIGWQFNDTNLVGWIDIKNDKVSMISIGDPIPNRSRFGMRVDQLIKKYGSPTDIYYSVGGGDVAVINVSLINRDTGIWWRYSQPYKEQLIIPPDQFIPWIVFFDPHDFKEIIIDKHGVNDYELHHYEWSGYTEIDIN